MSLFELQSKLNNIGARNLLDGYDFLKPQRLHFELGRFLYHNVNSLFDNYDKSAHIISDYDFSDMLIDQTLFEAKSVNDFENIYFYGFDKYPLFFDDTINGTYYEDADDSVFVLSVNLALLPDVKFVRSYDKIGMNKFLLRSFTFDFGDVIMTFNLTSEMTEYHKQMLIDAIARKIGGR